MCIMNEAKTTTQPQPPSGGVGSSLLSEHSSLLAELAAGRAEQAEFSSSASPESWLALEWPVYGALELRRIVTYHVIYSQNETVTWR